MSGQKLSKRELRDAFGLFATGVTVVTAVSAEGEPLGTTANSFTSVSLDPPALLWCLASSSSTRAAFVVGAPFAVHVLAHDQRDLALHFARRSRDKFEIDGHWRAKPLPPQVADVLCRFECLVTAVHPAGDHSIIVGEVTAITRHQGGSALVFFSGRFGSFVSDRGSPHVDVWHNWRDEWV